MMQIRSMEEAVDYLYNALPVFHRQGPAAYKADIGNIAALMAAVDNPHLKGTKYIHIAGTNGKGSTAHLTAAYLQTLGYKVGVYTSPHYVNMRERIKINGQWISETDFVEILNKFLTVNEHIKPSYFELICAIALLYFEQEKVDFAIIETGMGGRLDSTNIITPILSVITNISFDHQQFLGNTLASIAQEKAGIIKKGIPCVIGEKNDETEEVFMKTAQLNNSLLSFSEDHFQCEWQGFDGDFTTYVWTNIATQSKQIIKTRLHGQYQAKNIELLCLIAKELDISSGIPYNWIALQASFIDLSEKTYFIGRWQKVSDHPLTILESAHNIAGIREVTRQIEQINFKKLYIIFGTVSDKDVNPLFEIMPKDAEYIWVQADIPRAMDAAKLSEKGAKNGLKGRSIPVIHDALSYTRHATEPEDLIIIMGSIFVVGEALSYFDKKRTKSD